MLTVQTDYSIYADVVEISIRKMRDSAIYYDIVFVRNGSDKVYTLTSGHSLDKCQGFLNRIRKYIRDNQPMVITKCFLDGSIL